MIHEFKEIISQARINQEKHVKNVLVTVVDLEGSSYRKPGVRMLISEDGKMTGAISGGCVEKEIQHRSKSVFEKGIAKVITYDGRYKLGCEGILYILIEPFALSENLYKTIHKAITQRASLKIESFYKKENEAYGNFGSILSFDTSVSFPFYIQMDTSETMDLASFQQTLSPAFRLLIIGAEHDAVKLCEMAALLGWQVDIITSLKDPKESIDFPGVNSVIASTPEMMDYTNIDTNTGIVIMNHSYAQDLKYVLKLVDSNPAYLGILGAAKRREKMFNELFEYNPEISETFLERIFTPAGLNIGARTPEEIALSILAEILAKIKNKTPYSLKEITGKTQPH